MEWGYSTKKKQLNIEEQFSYWLFTSKYLLCPIFYFIPTKHRSKGFGLNQNHELAHNNNLIPLVRNIRVMSIDFIAEVSTFEMCLYYVCLC